MHDTSHGSKGHTKAKSLGGEWPGNSAERNPQTHRDSGSRQVQDFKKFMETGFGYDMEVLSKKPNVLNQTDHRPEVQEESLKPPSLNEIRQVSRRSILSVSNGQSPRNPSQRQIVNRLRAERTGVEELRRLKQDYDRLSEEQRYKHFKPFKLLDPSLNLPMHHPTVPAKSNANTPTEGSSPPQIVILPMMHKEAAEAPKMPLRDIFKAHLKNNQTSIQIYNEYCRQKNLDMKKSVEEKLQSLKATFHKTQSLQRSKEDDTTDSVDFNKKLFEQNCSKLEHENVVKQFQSKLKRELEEGSANIRKIKDMALKRQETARSKGSSVSKRAVFARNRRPLQPNPAQDGLRRSNNESEDQLHSR